MRDLLAPSYLGRDFRWLFGSSAVSNLADGIMLAAGPLLVASVTHEPFVVAMAVFLQQLPWVLFALGQLFFVTGDVLSYNYEKFFGQELPYPAISDAFYLAVYPCLVAGILLIIRRRSAGRDRGGLIDALVAPRCPPRQHRSDCPAETELSARCPADVQFH